MISVLVASSMCVAIVTKRVQWEQLRCMKFKIVDARAK